MKSYVKVLVPLAFLWTVSSCAQIVNFNATNDIRNSISKYYSVASKIKLGDSREKVFEILDPTQSSLPRIYRKASDVFIKDENIVEVHYYRTGHISDGLTTDDEFTPYLFKNGKLESIGWLALGGPKTVGKVPQSAPQNFGSRTSGSPTSRSGAQGGKVYDRSECIGPVIMGRCEGSIIPNKAYHPTCHGTWLNGQCTGPMF